MLATDLLTAEDLSYCIDIRRKIHRHPELGFDLPVTTALVGAELENMGYTWDGSYAPSSAVSWVNPEGTGPCVMLRADMDALPVTEKTGLPFSSEIPGHMHACGHDTHTAILLTVGRVLARIKDQLPCKVMLLFQPSEECEQSGAKVMVENGVMDEVDYCICTHCGNSHHANVIGSCIGDYCAACDPITIVFHGKTAHATRPHNGVDAIRMALAAQDGLEKIVKEEVGDRKHIWALGVFRGGTAHNVVADECELRFSFRYFDMEFAAKVRERGVALLKRIAADFGGSVDIDWNMSAPPVINDPILTERFRRSVDKLSDIENIEVTYGMGSEDFSYYMLKKPGLCFHYGSGNEEKYGKSFGHCNNFIVDEDSFRAPILAFLQFVLDAEPLTK